MCCSYLCIISFPDGRSGYEINRCMLLKRKALSELSRPCFQVLELYITTFSNELKAWNAITCQSWKRPFYKSSRHLVQGWLPSHSTSYISKFQFPGQNASRNYEGIGDIHAGIKTMRNNFNLPPRSVREKPWRQVWHRHKNHHWTDGHALHHPFKGL